MSVGVLHLAVLEAKDVIAANSNGSSDPYCYVTVSGSTQHFRTNTIKHTRNPSWAQTYVVNVDNTSQTVLLEVYNENWVRKDEFLGQVELRPADFAGGSEQDLWLPLLERPTAANANAARKPSVVPPVLGAAAPIITATAPMSAATTAQTLEVTAAATSLSAPSASRSDNTEPISTWLPTTAAVPISSSSMQVSDGITSTAAAASASAGTEATLSVTSAETRPAVSSSASLTAPTTASTAPISPRPNERAASRPYDHNVARGLIHIKVLFNSMDPLLFPVSSSPSPLGSSSAHRPSVSMFSTASAPFAPAVGSSPVSMNKSEMASAERDDAAVIASSAPVDLQLGTEDDGTGTGDSAGTGSKVDAILSRREQLKQHVHSKLAKLRSIRLLDPPKTNNTSQDVTSHGISLSSSANSIRSSTVADAGARPTGSAPAAVMGSDQQQAALEAIRLQIAAEQEIGFVPKDKHRFLNFNLVPSASPSGSVNAASSLRVSYVDPDTPRKVFMDMATSSSVLSSTSPMIDAADARTRGDRTLNTRAAEQTVYSDGYYISDEAVGSSTVNVSVPASAGSSSNSLGLPRPAPITPSLELPASSGISTASAATNVSDSDLVFRLAELHKHLQDKTAKLHILKQAYAAKDGETKRLTARITELEAALSEQKELNRSLVRARHAVTRYLCRACLERVNMYRLTTPSYSTEASSAGTVGAGGRADAISIIEHKKVVAQLESELRLVQQDRARLMIELTSKQQPTPSAVTTASPSGADSSKANRKNAASGSKRPESSPRKGSSVNQALSSAPVASSASASAVPPEIAVLQQRFGLDPTSFLIDSYACSGGKLHVFTEHLCFEPSAFALSLTPQQNLVLRLWSIIEITKTKSFIPMAPVGFSVSTSEGKVYEFSSVAKRDECAETIIQQAARLQHKISVRT